MGRRVAGGTALQHARAMFVCACVHDLFCLLEILSGAGVDLIYHYIFGDMSVIRTRRSAHVFVRTISVVVDYFLVLLGAFNPVWDNPVASRAAPARYGGRPPIYGQHRVSRIHRCLQTCGVSKYRYHL